VPASLRHAESLPTSHESSSAEMVPVSASPQPVNGTVVMEVAQGGIVVPSFVGKSLRSSIELAQNSGLELDIIGSGRALDQSPAPGAHVASGARIMVKFGR
jgi:cell division protein FtsI (penicillin-binding protein 3)